MRSGILISVVSLLLAGASSNGCARQSAHANQPTTIVFAHAKHPNSAYLSELVGTFERQNPGIRVREEILPSSSDQQHQYYVINLAARARDVDVFDMDVIWVPEFARAGWLEDLTRHLQASELAPLNRAALEADWLDHRIYAVPWFVDAGVLYYRKDLLSKYGYPPPQTYEELVSATRAITTGEHDPQLAGFVWQGMQYEGLVCVALEFMRGNGGAILGDSTQPPLAQPATLQALRFMSDLIRVYKVSPPMVTTLDEEATRHIFQSGRAVFMRNWPYAWSLLNQAGSPVAGRVGLTLVPHFPGHGSVPTLGGFHLGVNAYSTHKQAAIAFVRFMIRESVQKQILLKLGVLPAHMQVYEDPEARQGLPFFAEIFPTLEQMRARPVTPYYPMISQILQPGLSAVVAGLSPPAKAMRSADAQIRHLLGQP